MKQLRKILNITNTYLKKTGISILLLLTFTLLFTLSGCGKNDTMEVADKEVPDEDAAEYIPEGKVYPEPDDVGDYLEEEGYEVERFNSFEELEIDVTRVKAEKDGKYLDICYDVASLDDLNTIIEYYVGSYAQYNLVSDTEKGIVYCYSDESIVKDIGFE